MNKYYADVRIFVRAENAQDAAKEINDAVSYAVHSAGFDLEGYDSAVYVDMVKCKEDEE